MTIPKKSSQQLDREIATHLVAAEQAETKSRRMGSHAVHNLLARFGFEHGIDMLTTDTAHEIMRQDTARTPVDPKAWMEGWTRAAKGEREDARRMRMGQPYIPLGGLELLFRK